ncbi:MAG: hypothetical protein QMD21_00850 [Candidatus Thermoplasmatota archaeon]|nr:hypothetical protein [Candidatus Thermoplasmatota archaeon]
MQDKKGIARLIEFFMVFTIFIIIIGGFYAIVNIYRPAIMSYLEEDTMRLVELLISQPGFYTDTAIDNWEDYGYEEIINAENKSIGLAINSTVRVDNQTYGILHWGKIHKLINNTTEEWYECVRSVLKLKEGGYHLNITFTNLTTNEKYYFGNESAGKYGFCWKRITVVYNGNYIPFAIEVRLAKRQ